MEFNAKKYEGKKEVVKTLCDEGGISAIYPTLNDFCSFHNDFMGNEWKQHGANSPGCLFYSSLYK